MSTYGTPSQLQAHNVATYKIEVNFLCALDSADFDISPQTITFPRDEDILPVQVLLTDDKILEEKERFIVTLNITGNVEEVIVGRQDPVIVTIEDNDGKYMHN